MYLNKWETMVSEQKITKDQFLTQSTAEGFRVSITSTIELITYLLEELKFKYVLTSKLNQDPLEVLGNFTTTMCRKILVLGYIL